MGKSTSCFKLITCGGDSAEKYDAVDVTESKRSSDKKVWSFLKRSERQRVLSNTVIQEATSGGLKESQESAGFEFQQSDVSVAPDKTSTVQFTEEKPQLINPKEYIEEKSELMVPKEYDEEKPQPLMPIEDAEEKSQLLTLTKCSEEKSQPLTPEESKVTEPVSATTNEAEDDSTLDESLVVIIQTAIRGFLAQKELRKLRNLVKLQAAVRGHLVRRHAVGTLRCVQAIVKMQLLVRASLSQGSYAEMKLNDKNQEGNQRLQGSSATKKNSTYSSMEKLLSNRFARQIMDSTPKTKPIHIKCDTSKPNSAWSWLERWMSVSSSEKSLKEELPIEQPEQTKSDDCDSPLTAVVLSDVIFVSNELDVRETLVSSESEENLITYDATNFSFEACQPASSSVTDDLEQHQINNVSTSDLKETSHEVNSQGKTMQIDAHSPIEVSCLSNKPEIESEQPKHSMKRSASEQLEKEAKKSVFGSRKAGNPAFIATQTKFEELSSTGKSSRSTDSSHEDVKVESNVDTVSSGTDTISRSKEPSFAENPVLSNWRVQHGGSECGTELSITSTLDSPDISEVGTLEYENGAKVLEQENCSSNSPKGLDVKDNDTVAMPVPDSSLSVADQPEKLDGSKAGSTNLIAVDSPLVEQEPLKSTAYLPRERDSIKNQAYRSSPEASPRSHMTVPESQGTPSEVSVKAKKKKTDKSSQKRKSLSAAKGSPSTPVASSIEQLHRDQKNGKRRNSFSSTRPENIDEEPRDTNSSNSVPRFMQATESARAKLSANNSPRSSPDVQDRDISIKKRHSLPAANRRQGSPRIQRLLSQAQQAAKGNGANPIPERRWQR
ncbi:zinc finger CCCH domain-containing protein 6-like [Hibiscus syriacus]|uniref:Zinc finger CCCH domain-containing protein 6-like n=1 Tax=Hibiscus syriacus TaxID=106335 RepID=A0A6A2W8J6_HIBSY|nr:zinc finger CCCH domain-containing protein 6-like [Hibiscus syriacus]